MDWQTIAANIVAKNRAARKKAAAESAGMAAAFAKEDWNFFDEQLQRITTENTPKVPESTGETGAVDIGGGI